jgi:hypothetical protein
MAVSRKQRIALFERAGGRCECTSARCSHHDAGERCNQDLADGWEVYIRRAKSGKGIENLIGLCAICFKNMQGNGRMIEQL